MDEHYDVKHGNCNPWKGLWIRWNNNDEIDSRVDEMLDFVESFKGSVGGTLGENMEVCVDFPAKL